MSSKKENAIKVIHVGEDYAKIIIAKQEFDIDFNLLARLFQTEHLAIDPDSINEKEFLKWINSLLEQILEGEKKKKKK